MKRNEENKNKRELFLSHILEHLLYFVLNISLHSLYLQRVWDRLHALHSSSLEISVSRVQPVSWYDRAVLSGRSRVLHHSLWLLDHRLIRDWALAGVVGRNDGSSGRSFEVLLRGKSDRWTSCWVALQPPVSLQTFIFDHHLLQKLVKFSRLNVHKTKTNWDFNKS